MKLTLSGLSDKQIVLFKDVIGFPGDPILKTLQNEVFLNLVAATYYIIVAPQTTEYPTSTPSPIT